MIEVTTAYNGIEDVMFPFAWKAAPEYGVSSPSELDVVTGGVVRGVGVVVRG